MEAELAIKIVGVDLQWHLQKDHFGEAAAMGVGGVVVIGGLTIQPKIDHLKVVATGTPGAAPLGG